MLDILMDTTDPLVYNTVFNKNGVIEKQKPAYHYSSIWERNQDP